MPSLLWLPEAEYRSWQSDQFKKKAEEMAFPGMARKLVQQYEPPATPPNPPVGPDQWEGLPGGLPPSPVPPAGPTGSLPGFLPTVPVQGPRFGQSALGVPSDREDIGTAYQGLRGWQEESAQRYSQMLSSGTAPEIGQVGLETFPGAGSIGAIGVGLAGMTKPAAKLGAKLLPSGEVVSRAVSRTGTSLEKIRGSLEETTLPIGERIIEAKDKFLRAFFDRNAPLKELESASGVPTHKLAQVVSGMTAAGEDTADRTVLPILKLVGKDINELELYMTLRRMQDIVTVNPNAKLPGLGAPSGRLGREMRHPELWATSRRIEARLSGQGQNRLAVQTAIDDFTREMGPSRLKTIEDAAKQLWKLNDVLVLRPRVTAGLLSEKGYQAIRAKHPHYIDFHRADYAVSPPIKGGERVATLSDIGIDRMAEEGSDIGLDQPLARWLTQVIRTPETISRNEAAKGIYLALRKQNEELVRLVGPSERAVTTKDQGIISFFKDGEQQRAIVPKIFADVAQGLEAESAGFLGKVAMAAAAPLRMGATTYNPAFVIINPIRDFITAAFKEGWGTVLSTDYIKGWIAAFTKNSDFSDAAQAGVLMSGIIDSYHKTADLKSAAKMIGGISVTTPKDMLLAMPRFLEAMNVVSERATRIGTFKHLQRQGVSDLEAAVRARNVTVDFAKSGNVTRVINQAIPFLNAGIQGATNTLAVMKNPRLAILRASPLVAADTMSFLWNQRYETASMIPDYEYANNFILMFGEGTKNPDPQNPNAPAEKFPLYFKLPKGPAGALLTVPSQLAMRLAWNSGDRSIADIALESVRDTVQSISPIEMGLGGVMPPLGQTAVGVTTNKDIFRNVPIVPRREEQRPPELQYGGDTSKLAVALGQQFKVSPRLIEFGIKDLTAGTGQFGLWLTDLAVGALVFNPQVPGAVKQQKLTPAEEQSRTPVLSRFMGTRNTQQERLDWEKFRKATEESRRGLATVPETVRLGINLGEVPESFKVKGQDRVLTTAERTKYQQGAGDIAKQAVSQVTSSSRYKAADDTTKAEMIREVTSLGREYVRNNLDTFGAGQTTTAAREILQAFDAMATYRAMPRFVMKMDKTQEQTITEIIERIRARERTYPAQSTDKLARALWEEIKRAKTPQAKKVVNMAGVILRNPDYYNPRRRQFWASNPLLQKYYSDVVLE